MSLTQDLVTASTRRIKPFIEAPFFIQQRRIDSFAQIDLSFSQQIHQSTRTTALINMQSLGCKFGAWVSFMKLHQQADIELVILLDRREVGDPKLLIGAIRSKLLDYFKGVLDRYQ